MDTVLLVVTILSLAMAMAMAFIVTKLLREERARSEARVSALSEMAAQPAQLDDLEIRPETETVTVVSHLFEAAAAPSPWPRRFAVIGVLGALVMPVSFVLSWTHTRAVPSRSLADATTPQPVVLDSAPLELVSLHHVQEAQRLVISGLVQNPRGGAAISHVVATAFVFGPDGAFLTSSRAPLDFTTLTPGDESAFVVNVPVTGPVARYRIGFRTEDGRVIEHVDKRAPDALAQK